MSETPWRLGDDKYSFARVYEDIGGGTSGDYSYVMGSSHKSLHSLGIQDLVVFEGLNGSPQNVKFMLSMEDDFQLAKHRHATTPDPGAAIFTDFYDVDYYWVDPDGDDVKLGISPSPPTGLYKAMWTDDASLDLVAAMADDEHVWDYSVPYHSVLKSMTLAMIGIPRTVKTNDTTKYSLPGAVEGDDGTSYPISSYHVGFLDTQDRFRYTSESQYYGLVPYSLDHREIPTDLDDTTNRRSQINNSSNMSIAGSWPSFRNYYVNAWGLPPGHSSSDAETGVGAYEYSDGRSITMLGATHMALLGSKEFIRQRYWSMLYVKACESHPPATSGEEENEENSADNQSGDGDTDNETSDTAFTPAKPGLQSLGGIFTHDYYGPLTSISQIPMSVTSKTFDGEAINLTLLAHEAWDRDAVTYQDHVALFPALSHSHLGVASSLELSSDGTTATFVFPDVKDVFGTEYRETGGWYAQYTSALKYRFEIPATSLERAQAYVDYYSAYLEAQITEETLPREYKTKMQASRPIRVEDLSAIVGTVDYVGDPATDPTPSTSGGSTPSTSMGEY